MMTASINKLVFALQMVKDMNLVRCLINQMTKNIVDQAKLMRRKKKKEMVSNYV